MSFTVLGCADVEDRFRAYVNVAFGADVGSRKIQHMHKSMEDQVEGKSCCFHPGQRCSFSPESDVHLAVTGTPCPPYSTQRNKRGPEGQVRAHPQYYVTDQMLPQWIDMCEPKVVIFEQVLGFGLAEDDKDPSSPLTRQRVHSQRLCDSGADLRLCRV